MVELNAKVEGSRLHDVKREARGYVVDGNLRKDK
jgi:hypothetical protein